MKEMIKNNKTVVVNYIALLSIQGTNFLLPLITYPYLVRVLNVEKFGVVMMANSLMVFLNILVDFGFIISATREISIIRDDKEQLSDYFWHVLAAKFIFLILGAMILGALVWGFPMFRRYAAVYFFSYGIVIGQALFPTWFFQGIERMQIITLINLLAKIVFAVSIFVFVKRASDYTIVPVLNSLGFLVAGITGLLLSLRHVNFSKPKRGTIRRLVKENLPLVVSNFSAGIYNSGNTFILGIFAGEMYAGIYSGFEKLIMATKSLYTPLFQALLPRLSFQYAKGEKLIPVIRKIRLGILASALVIVAVVILFAREILQLVYANPLMLKYAYVFRLMSLVTLFSSLNMLYVSLVFTALKKFQWRMNAMLIGGVTNLILSVSGAKWLGIQGVAMSVVFSELVILLVAYYYFQKLKKLKLIT